MKMLSFHTTFKTILGKKSPSILERAITVSAIRKPVLQKYRFKRKILLFQPKITLTVRSMDLQMFPVWKRFISRLQLTCIILGLCTKNKFRSKKQQNISNNVKN